MNNALQPLRLRNGDRIQLGERKYQCLSGKLRPVGDWLDLDEPSRLYIYAHFSRFRYVVIQ